MKILIIGGTNFIGPSVVRQLITMGHDVTVFHRGQTKADLPKNVHHIFGERSQLRDYKSDFESLSLDVVVDMISYTESEARMLRKYKPRCGNQQHGCIPSLLYPFR